MNEDNDMLSVLSFTLSASWGSLCSLGRGDTMMRNGSVGEDASFSRIYYSCPVWITEALATVGALRHPLGSAGPLFARIYQAGAIWGVRQDIFDDKCQFWGYWKTSPSA